MGITVFGCGRWGAFLAWYLDKCGEEVTLYGRKDSKRFSELEKTGTNGTVKLKKSIELCADMSRAAENDIFIIALASQQLRGFMREITEYGVKDKIFVLCMKGLELGTNKRLSSVAAEFLGEDAKIAVWLGPGHPQEFVVGIPNCMVIDSLDNGLTQFLVDKFSGKLIRFYYGTDLIGNEIGAAAKNVVGIAAGMLDGLGMPSLKGGLMSRAPHEIARLIESLGGDGISAYGLCHLGDYEATLFSPHSNNRLFGELAVKGERLEALAEGYYSVKALCELGKENGIELPICRVVYDVLYNKKKPADAISELFGRAKKKEFNWA